MLGNRLYCPLLFLLLPVSLAAQNVITTIAGIDPVFKGDGKPAVSVGIGYINGVATDGSGNVYFTDPLEHLVLRVAPDGTLSVIAGNGIAAYSGDGGPATAAAIAATDDPQQYVGPPVDVSLGGIVVDNQGNIFFGDGRYVRRIAKDGTITTVAGGGINVPGDGMRATLAALGIVRGLAFDSAGNLYFCEGNRVRKMTPDGTLTTYAGTGSDGFSGDNGLATAAQLSKPSGLAFDAQGNLYVADGDVFTTASHIRMIAVGGKITTIAGGGNKAPADGAAPLTLDLGIASGVAVDSQGAVYVFSPINGYLMKFSGGSTTLITRAFAAAFVDNVPARNAFVVGQRLFDNSGIALDGNGNLYVADSRDGRLCKIDKQGFLTTVAGNGSYGFGGDGGPAQGGTLHGPTFMTQVPNGTIYFLDALNVRVRAISPNGVITTVLSVDNFPDLGVLETLNDLASDSSGNLYVLLVDRLLKLAPDGTIQIIVNQANKLGDSGDGGPAAQASIRSGGGVTIDSAGNLYLSDPVSAKIRKVTPDQKIHAFAGTGTQGVSPDGAVAATSPVSFPSSLLADNQGGLYFVEAPPPPVFLGTAVVRYITPDGLLKTIAGNGMPLAGFSGDGNLAVQAGLMMQNRTGLALDKAGNLYIADCFNGRVRVVSNGIINTFAGNGESANDGDGGLAKGASFFVPKGLLFKPNGDLLISDVAGNRIREVLAAPPPISVSPTQMSFSAKAGGALTPPQKLTMSSPVSGLGFLVTKSPGADWLVVTAPGGFTPQLIGIRADPANLAPGPYQATITITSPLAASVTTSVTVTLQVAPGDNPKLAVDKAALSFTFPSNPTVSETQRVRVSNAGTGTLAFAARAQTFTGGAWLSVSPAAGSVTPQSPAFLAVTADPSGLRAGTYTGTPTISSSTTGESATLLATLTVSTLDQAIRLSHPALSFLAVAGGGVIPPGSFAISNIGRGTMNFSVSTHTLSGGQQWLATTPQSGAAVSGSRATTVTVTVNPAGLGPGFYYGFVRVDSAAAANTPQVATILLLVLPAGQDPGPLIDPSDIVVTATQGAPPPGSINLFVYNISAKPQSYVSSFATATPGNKLKFIPASSTLNLTEPTRLVLQPLTAGLVAGVYESELTLQFSDGNIRRVGVRTIVTPASAAASASDPSSAASRDAAGCTPSQLVPAITTLGQSFGVPAAWPVVLKADVRDDCGNALDTGSVNATFSNGDPPLSLQSIQGGLWNATWVSGHNSGPVTLTVTASDPARSLVGVREVTGGLGQSSQAPVLAAAVSGASFAANMPLAPGSIISLFGVDMANGVAPASAIPLDTTLAGATVLMAGKVLPLLYSSGGQINAVVPAGITTNTNHQIVVQRDLTLSVPILVDVAPSEPATFFYPFPGDPPSQGAIVNAITYVPAHSATPAAVGDILAIFCTGLGAVDQAVPDGAGAPVSPPANTTAVPMVTIGGKIAPVAFSGLAPGFVGLYQIDATVPSGVASGNQVPVVVSIAGQTGPPTTIAVK